MTACKEAFYVARYITQHYNNMWGQSGMTVYEEAFYVTRYLTQHYDMWGQLFLLLDV